MVARDVGLDSPANIFLIALLMHAASRRTTNSKPSLDMSVTYLLEPCFWLELAMIGWLRRMCECWKSAPLVGDASWRQRSGGEALFHQKHVMTMSIMREEIRGAPLTLST